MTETIPHPRGSEAEPGSGQAAGGPAPLLVCVPMRIEVRAIRRGLRGSTNPPEVLRTGSTPVVLRTGYGTTRAPERAAEISHRSFGQMAIMAVGGGLAAALHPGAPLLGTRARTRPPDSPPP